MGTVSSVSPRLGYALVFGIATLACFVSVVRARHVDDRDTRYGLVGLLVASGGWAASHFALFVAPTTRLKIIAYVVGLVLGFSTVFVWLYFCSAYTGRSYHRSQRWLAAGAGLYLGVVVVKLTNPIHGIYFEARIVRTPFPHLAITQGWFHWVVMGLAYALATVGLFMLLEMFEAADYNTRPLAVLTGTTALPVALDIVGFTSDALMNVIYAPLGVAAFAVGILFVYEERFLAVQLTGDIDDPVMFLDDDRRVVDYNEAAARLVPGLQERGGPIDAVPELADALGMDQGILTVDTGEETRHYLVSSSSFDLGGAEIGAVVLFSDVTRIERQRRELQRHNEQLESFAEGIRHELRNSLQIVEGHVEAAGDAVESGDVDTARGSLETAARNADDMERTVNDLSTLAQYGRTITARTTIALQTSVDSAWASVDTGDLSLAVEGVGEVRADPDRLEELFENGFRFAVRNDASRVTIDIREDGFAIADDGTRPPDDRLEDLFEYGAAVPNAEVGVVMPTVRTLAEVHGWRVDADPTYEEGVRIVVSGARISRADPAA